jgi:hypothetical protein
MCNKCNVDAEQYEFLIRAIISRESLQLLEGDPKQKL